MRSFKDYLIEEEELYEDSILEAMAPTELTEAEYQGKTVQLNKPMRDTGGKKKFKVYVKNDKGNVVVVRFGDSKPSKGGLEIKRDDPKRRQAFRDRHNCSTAKDKTSARYWSCRFWGKTSVSDLLK